MDLERKLAEIVAYVEGAKAMPLSASCVVNRGELLAHLDELRALLPASVAEAELVLRDREQVVEEGREQAERLLAEARAQRARILERTDVMSEAAQEADRLVGSAREEAERMRREVDVYVDTKLANFEVVLERTLTAVHKGRDKLRGREFGDTLAPDAEPELPL